MNNRYKFAVAGLLGILAACSSEVEPVAPQHEPASVVTAPAAQTQPVSTPQQAAEASATQTPAAGVQIFIDPITGQQRAPTAAELAVETTKRAQSVSASSKSRPVVKVTALPNGVTEYDLGDAARVEESACQQADGLLGECSAAQKQELRAKAQQPGK